MSLLLVVFTSTLLSVELHVKPVCTFAFPFALATTENLMNLFLLLVLLCLESSEALYFISLILSCLIPFRLF